MKTPGVTSLTDIGLSVSFTLMGSIICAHNFGVPGATNSALFHCESLNPGLSQPCISLVASYSSPSYSLLAMMGPFADTFHVSSLEIDEVVPSSNSSESCMMAFGKLKFVVFAGTLV